MRVVTCGFCGESYVKCDCADISEDDTIINLDVASVRIDDGASIAQPELADAECGVNLSLRVVDTDPLH